MSSGVTLITCTGDRHDSFALLETFIEDTHFDGDIDWIVVDDGEVPVECTKGQRHVRRERTEPEGTHTLAANILVALDQDRKHDIVCFAEDDDYYAPAFLSTYVGILGSCPYTMIGEGLSRYYWLPTRKFWRHGNVLNSSLAQSGFKGERALEALRWSASIPGGNSYIDKRLWDSIDMIPGLTPFTMNDRRDGNPLHVSLKGFYGRRGLDDGHNPHCPFYRNDTDMMVLKRWIRDRKHRESILDTIDKRHQRETPEIDPAISAGLVGSDA